MKYFTLALPFAAVFAQNNTVSEDYNPQTEADQKVHSKPACPEGFCVPAPSTRSGGRTPPPIVRASTGEVHAQTGLYLRSYAPSILAEFLNDDSAIVDMILTHGCFCAKLDNTNPYAEFLGGTTPVDALDEICRDWLRARNCNDNLVGGSCHADREAMRVGSYSIDRHDPAENSLCGFTATECAADTCEIDVQHVASIANFMADNPGHVANTVEGAGTCDLAPLEKKERKCLGDAPNVYPKRMGNIEMLYTRMDWVDDKNDDDEVFFNAGGLKINDDKEYISISVHNQLLTFNWPNVKSFTVTNREDANPFYVGFVEKARVNNYQVGETLGDDTKGGVRTTGIFSGDGTIRALDGMSYAPANPSNNFYEFGEYVTVTHENNFINYYVNGIALNSIDVSDWEGVYPAIDTQQQLTLRVTNVEFYDE